MSYFENVIKIKHMLLPETLATLYMTGATAVIAGFFGLILGVILSVTEEGGILENKLLYSVLDKIVNIGRSIPYIILIAILAKFTRLVAGTTIGNTAAIVSLSVATIPFFARQVQNALAGVDKGMIEAAQSMGFGAKDIIWSVYLPEAREGLIRNAAVTLISVIGLSAMAGAVAAGGLGKLALAYGYNRLNTDITIVCTVLILLIVFIIQWVADLIVAKIKH